MAHYRFNENLDIPLMEVTLKGQLAIPENAKGIIVFAHGSGSSQHSPRNQYVAKALQESGYVTLLFDLLTETEDLDAARRFDIELLTK
jgi:putative phosphoribosyl transferase